MIEITGIPSFSGEVYGEILNGTLKGFSEGLFFRFSRNTLKTFLEKISEYISRVITEKKQWISYRIFAEIPEDFPKIYVLFWGISEGFP